MMNTFDLMGPINISIYNEYYIVICNHYKLNDLGSDVAFQLTSQGTYENSFLGEAKRMFSSLLMSRFFFLHGPLC